MITKKEAIMLFLYKNKKATIEQLEAFIILLKANKVIKNE